MPDSPAIAVQGLSHRYGDRTALDGLSFDVARGEIFGLLGPNGSGKTTLFRMLCTLLPVQTGQAFLLGRDVSVEPDAVRREIGITFQSPSLDDRLTVRENLRHQGHLYGLSGPRLRDRITDLLGRVGMTDRAGDVVSTLSGGMKRRVEIAKGLLHQPQLLLLDEPSTGLDPGARRDLWRYVKQLRDEQGVTILVTTHLLEEAEQCDRLAILNRGVLVALDSPDALRASIGGDCVSLRCADPETLARSIRERFSVPVQQVGDSLRIERAEGHRLIVELIEAYPEAIASISLSKPTLEDVFVLRTGHRFWEEPVE